MTDFRKIILDLMQQDKSLQDIHDRTGISKSALSRLLHGQRTDPLHSTGEKLLAMHKEVCGDESE